MKTKFDIHLHTNLDPIEGKRSFNLVTYSPLQLFKKAQRLNYKVLALTHHKDLIFTKQLFDLAKKHNILLVPGVEAIIEGVDVVILNPINDKIKTFEELKKEKEENKDCFIFAPHPFFPAHYCLKHKLIEHIELFDGIECSSMNYGFFEKYNTNAKAVAKHYDLPFIATSDLHQLEYFGRSYSTLDANVKTVKQFIKALKTKRIVRHRRRLNTMQMIHIGTFHFIGKIKARLSGKKSSKRYYS